MPPSTPSHFQNTGICLNGSPWEAQSILESDSTDFWEESNWTWQPKRRTLRRPTPPAPARRDYCQIQDGPALSLVPLRLVPRHFPSFSRDLETVNPLCRSPSESSHSLEIWMAENCPCSSVKWKSRLENDIESMVWLFRKNENVSWISSWSQKR